MNSKEKVLAVLAHGAMTPSQLAIKLKLAKSTIGDIKKSLVRTGKIERCGTSRTDKGSGYEGLYCIKVEKPPRPKAKNAFDWRNLDTPPMFSARDISFNHSTCLIKKEDRVVVYSRA
tara:strand:+ start:574 stop:924 length:351 start_codon:yes stop_codon:yes gene_type:complete